MSGKKIILQTIYGTSNENIYWVEMQINVIDLTESDKKAMTVGGMKIISNKKHRKLIWSKVHAKKKYGN